MRASPDIVVCGGGMVGSAQAALLAAGAPGLRLLVLDAGDAPVWSADDEPDLRVSALSEASRRILERCDAWATIEAGRVSPYRRMEVWDEAESPGGGTSLAFDSAELGRPLLGHIVENRLVRSALMTALRRRGVEVWFGARLTGLESGESQVELSLEDGRRLRTSLVIGADGARSPTRRLAGLPVTGREYGQRALVGHVRFARNHGEVARQRFLSTGPLALLPLADGRVSIVWSTHPEQAGELETSDEGAFLTALTEASQGVLGSAEAVGARASFPLAWQHAPRYCAPRIVLVGDAAHTVHPLAGQGVNLGFLDAAVLAETLGAERGGDRDPGDFAGLRRYERRRKGENLLAMQSFSGLNRLFSNQSAALGYIRRAGLAAVAANPPLKQAFMRRAMGLEGDLPEILSESRV